MHGSFDMRWIVATFSPTEFDFLCRRGAWYLDEDAHLKECRAAVGHTFTVRSKGNELEEGHLWWTLDYLHGAKEMKIVCSGEHEIDGYTNSLHRMFPETTLPNGS